MQGHELLTNEQFCEYLGINRQQSAQMRYLGTGPRFINVTGRAIRYRWSDVEAWLDERSKTRTDQRRGAVA